jgi:phosphate transport system substrate-binding protein
MTYAQAIKSEPPEINAGHPKSTIRLFLTSPLQGSRRVFDYEAMADGCRNIHEIKNIFSANYRTSMCTTLRKDIVIEDDDTANRLQAFRRAPAGAVVLVSYDVYLENQSWTRLIPINGIVPSPETIVREEYNMTTPLFLIAKADLFFGTDRTFSQLGSWLTEALSERAIGNQGYLVKSGLMPLPSAQREAQRSSLKKQSDSR